VGPKDGDELDYAIYFKQMVVAWIQGTASLAKAEKSRDCKVSKEYLVFLGFDRAFSPFRRNPRNAIIQLTEIEPNGEKTGRQEIIS
jgi:hypothetical protein